MSEQERGIVCMFCGEGFGYAGDKPDEAIIKAAVDHEKDCPENPYKKRISELTDALELALRFLNETNWPDIVLECRKVLRG